MRSILPIWEVELARWLKPFLEQLGHKARRQVPALRGRADWAWRSQECSADGGAACTWRL